MLILNLQIKKSKTYIWETPISVTVIVKQIEINKENIRTMFGRAVKTSNRIYNQSLQNPLQERSYAAFAGKSKIHALVKKQFETHEAREAINPHAQYSTDFNIIYENPQDIRLYQIGNLITKPRKDSHNISNEQNYSFENKTQQIKFFKQPLLIVYDIHLVKNSKKYFDDVNIKSKIENTPEYKAMFNKVLEELKSKAIKFKVAETQEDFQETGFNALIKLNPPQEKNTLLETLSIKKANEE